VNNTLGQKRQAPMEGDSLPFFSGFIFGWCKYPLEVPTSAVVEMMDYSLWDSCLQPAPGYQLVPCTSSWTWPWHANIYMGPTPLWTWHLTITSACQIVLHQGALSL